MKRTTLTKSTLYPICIFLVFAACNPKKTEITWSTEFSIIGSQSSPKVSDLNGDGVFDVVMGAGKNEYQFSEQGIIAVDGKTGEVLWQQGSEDQVYGIATFLDVTSDGIDDIFIGGRSPNYKAINGKTGELLWKYQYKFEGDSILKHARFNFYNSALVPDQNGDGLPDLLNVNGGNSKAQPGSEENRFPAVMLLMDSKTGEVLAADTMPDGGESYMSPVTFAQPGNMEQWVVFGTGGETISGNLYLTTIKDLTSGSLENAKILAAEAGHGFIAPPVVVDINRDGYFDIVAISHGSSIFAIDGKTHEYLWTGKIGGTECSNAFAVGYFTDDDVPDFFTFVSKGQWPDNTGSLQIMIDGRSGKIAYTDSIGCTGFSSPVVYDLNSDGVDEAIISINEFDCEQGFANKKSGDIQNRLIAIDFANNRVIPIDQLVGFKNIFSTPCIGDLDNDGYLDIVHCQYFNPGSDLMAFLGMKITRISTHLKARKQPVWGSYMGSEGNGIFPMEALH